jgi:ribonuclease P protein subunit POP4
MVITRHNIQRHELIGMNVEIINSSDNGHVGFTGQIVDETKNTLTIKTSKGDKMIQKNGLVMKTGLKDSDVIILGSHIKFRPEDRIKRAGRRGTNKSKKVK